MQAVNKIMPPRCPSPSFSWKKILKNKEVIKGVKPSNVIITEKFTPASVV